MQCFRLNRFGRFCNADAYYIFADLSGDSDLAAFIPVCFAHCNGFMTGTPHGLLPRGRMSRFEYIQFYPDAQIVGDHIVLDEQCYNLDGSAWTGESKPVPWFREYYSNLEEIEEGRWGVSDLYKTSVCYRTRILDGLLELEGYRMGQITKDEPARYNGRVVGQEMRLDVIQEVASIEMVRRECLATVLKLAVRDS